MANSMRGVHVNRVTPEVMDMLRRCRPALVKTIDHSGNWAAIKRDFDIRFLWGRVVYDPPTSDADEMYERMRPLMLSGRDVYDAWELPWNEGIDNNTSLGHRAAIERRFCERAADDGIDVVVLNANVGTPDPEPFVAAYGRLLAEVPSAKYVGVHEYWLPARYERPWWVGRWRRLYDALAPDVRARVRFLVGEAGIDGGLEAPPRRDFGWRSYGASEAQYVVDLDITDSAYEYPACVGRVLFSAGLYGAGDRWASFDVAGARAIEDWVARGPRHTLVAPVPGVEKKVKIGDIEVIDVRDEFPFVNGEYVSRAVNTITHMVQHHGGDGLTAPTMQAEALARLHAYHDWHVGCPAGPTTGNCWPAIGYHFGIDGSGRIYYTNGINLVAFHARAANAFGVGVVWLGDFRTRTPSKAMVDASRRLLRALEKELGRGLELRGHYEVQTEPTPCPGTHHWPATRTSILTTAGGGEFILGFAALAKALRAQGVNPGVPLHDVVFYTDGGHTQGRQGTTMGMMFWWKGSDASIFWHKDGRVFGFKAVDLAGG
jgi:hypothetical protein